MFKGKGGGMTGEGGGGRGNSSLIAVHSHHCKRLVHIMPTCISVCSFVCCWVFFFF